MYSALTMIFLPAFTNVYFTFKPQALFAKIAPIFMPIICISQYLIVLRHDLENFCFMEGDDSETLRRKYKDIISFDLKEPNLMKLDK